MPIWARSAFEGESSMRSVGEVVPEVVDQLGDEERTSFARMHPVRPHESPVLRIVGAVRATELRKHRCSGNAVLGGSFGEKLPSLLPVWGRPRRVTGAPIPVDSKKSTSQTGQPLLPGARRSPQHRPCTRQASPSGTADCHSLHNPPGPNPRIRQRWQSNTQVH